jgi:circadian clock protein KaiC
MLPKQEPKKKGFFSKLFKKKPKEAKEEKPGPKAQEKPKAQAETQATDTKAKPDEKGKKKDIAQVKQTSIQKLEQERMKAKQKFKYFMPDVPGVEGLFTHGIPSGAAVLVEGGPGSGKTIFCLQSCVGACKRGIKVLFMSFEEPEYRLREHLREFNFEPEEYERRGILKIKRFNALDIARSVEALLSEAKKELLIEIQPVLIPQDFKPDLIFVDSLTSISSAFSGEENRFRIYMEQLFRYLEANRITSFLIRETPAPTHIGLGYGGGQGGEAVSFLSDGIIVIYNVFPETGERKRAMEILKMRGEAIHRKLVEMDISSGKGMTIYPDKIVKGKYRLT